MAERLPPTSSERKHQAKRYNEGLKLVATLFNSLSIVTVGTAFVGPIIQKHYDVLTDGGWGLLLVAVCLHLIAQLAVRQLRAEE